MIINSQRKDNTFERGVTDMLSERLLTITGKDKAFRRNAASGSCVGGIIAQRMTNHDLTKATFGEIITPHGFRFTRECNHYKTPPTLASIIAGKRSQVDQWSVQATVRQRPATRYGDFVFVGFDNVLQREDGFFFEPCI